MGLLKKENKKICGQVEILYTEIFTMGDSEPFTYLSPPFYLNDLNGIGSDRRWMANEIRSKLKIRGYNCLLFPERLEDFVINELGLKTLDGSWVIKYEKFWKECNGDNWVNISVFGPGSATISFELHIDDENVINYINNLEGKYPIYRTTEKGK